MKTHCPRNDLHHHQFNLPQVAKTTEFSLTKEFLSTSNILKNSGKYKPSNICKMRTNNPQ